MRVGRRKRVRKWGEIMEREGVGKKERKAEVERMKLIWNME